MRSSSTLGGILINNAAALGISILQNEHETKNPDYLTGPDLFFPGHFVLRSADHPLNTSTKRGGAGQRSSRSDDT